MSITERRLNALRALAAGAQARTASSAFNLVDLELQDIWSSRRTSPQHRSNLLQVFHGMRALDSALKEVVRSYGHIPEHSLGRLLHQMNRFSATHPCHIDTNMLRRFLNSVVSHRNTIMHQANAFPRTNREAERMLGDMAACFSLLIR